MLKDYPKNVYNHFCLRSLNYHINKNFTFNKISGENMIKQYDCPYKFQDGSKCCDGSLYQEHEFCKYLTDLAKYNQIIRRLH